MGNQDDFWVSVMSGGPFVILLILIGIALFILIGYLWNYYMIQELKVQNKKMKELNDVLGYNLVAITKNLEQMNVLNAARLDEIKNTSHPD